MKKLNILFFMFLFFPNAFAGTTAHQAKIDSWISVNPSYCKGHSIGSDAPCIGDSRTKCTAQSFLNPDKKDNDEYGVLMMVAIGASDGGAYFCPVSVIGKNKDKDHSWTRYFSAGSESDCVWLCKPGYTGENCGQKNTDAVKTCDSTRLFQSNYDSVHAVGDKGKDVENEVLMKVANKYLDCYKNNPGKPSDKSFKKGQEHDAVLAISGWLDSGHGAWVRSYMIRAERTGWDNMSSWVDVYAASDSAVLACKDGYKINYAGNDCVPIDNSVCGDVNWCSGWNESNLKSDKHVQKKMGACVQWRCKETGYALSKSGASQCVECGTSQRDGVNPIDGTCVNCPEGMFFSATAKDSGYCSKAYALYKSDLMYGSGGSGADIKDQCWTKIDIDEYKECILGADFKSYESVADVATNQNTSAFLNVTNNKVIKSVSGVNNISDKLNSNNAVGGGNIVTKGVFRN